MRRDMSGSVGSGSMELLELTSKGAILTFPFSLVCLIRFLAGLGETGDAWVCAKGERAKVKGAVVGLDASPVLQHDLLAMCCRRRHRQCDKQVRGSPCDTIRGSNDIWRGFVSATLGFWKLGLQGLGFPVGRAARQIDP